MTSTKKERNVVVIELQGGNDALNTVIPHGNGLYYDFRSNVGIPQQDVLHLDDQVGLNPSLAPMKHLWDQGNLAIINGIGYPNPNRSHFRSRDVWYTAESERSAPTAGWAQPSATWMPAVKMFSPASTSDAACPGPWSARAYP